MEGNNQYTFSQLKKQRNKSMQVQLIKVHKNIVGPRKGTNIKTSPDQDSTQQPKNSWNEACAIAVIDAAVKTIQQMMNKEFVY